MLLNQKSNQRNQLPMKTVPLGGVEDKRLVHVNCRVALSKFSSDFSKLFLFCGLCYGRSESKCQEHKLMVRFPAN